MAEQSGFPDIHVEFPSGQFLSLQCVDEATRCAICCAIFNTPLLLRSCGHSCTFTAPSLPNTSIFFPPRPHFSTPVPCPPNYPTPCTVCAACIRQSVDFQERSGQPVCPSCRKPCDSRDLLPNLALRHLIELYTIARPDLLGLVNNTIQQQNEHHHHQQQEHRKRNKKSTIEETQQGEQQQLRRSSRRRSSQPMNDDANATNGGRGNSKSTKATEDNNPKKFSTRSSTRRRRRLSPSSSLHQHDDGDDDEKEHRVDPDFITVDLTGGSPADSNNDEWSDDSDSDSEEDDGDGGSPDGSLGKRKRRENASTKRKSQPTKNIPAPQSDAAGGTHITNNNKAGGSVPKNFVQCPICSKTVPEFYINSHVDSCLRRSQNGDMPSPSQPPPLPTSRLGSGTGVVGCHINNNKNNNSNGKEAGISIFSVNPDKSFQPLPVPPKLAPALATDKSLRGMLKKYSLPVEGKKPELLDRYNKFRLAVELANDRGEPTSYDRLAKKAMKMAVSTERQKTGLLAPLLFQGREGHLQHHHNSRPSSSSGRGGGGGMLQDPSSSVGAALGGGGAHENSIPLTGYSFKELIEVTRKRDAARKVRLAQQQQQQQSEEDEQKEQDVCTSQPRNGDDEEEGKKPQLENMQNNTTSTAATNAAAIQAKKQLVEETLMGIDPEELDDWGI